MNLVKRILPPPAYKMFKYFVVGCFATGTYLGSLYILTDFVGIYYLASTVIAFLISLFFSYTGHKYLTFKNFEKNHKKQFIIFTIVTFIGLLINISVIYIFVDILEIWYMIGAVVASAIVFVSNFFLNNYFTFKTIANEKA